jgi:hypothetical protein
VTKSTVFSRSFVSVNEDMPRSYLPAARPGMIASKVTFWMLAFRPITLARAFARSASIPITVLPSEAMNSSGG